MKKRLFIATAVLSISVLAPSCTVNKKKKCDTCPKWTSEVVLSDKTQLS